MTSPTGPSKRGRFVLRMTPELHTALHKAAAASGESLNAYCVRHLKTVEIRSLGDEDAMSLVGRARAVAGDALAAVVLHGSWARGEATAASDVDALVVVDSSLALCRALYRAWDAGRITWRGRRIDAHIVHPPRGGEISGLWAEVALDAVVLFERDWKLSSHLSRIRRAIAAGQLVRRVVHGQPYWSEAA